MNDTVSDRAIYREPLFRLLVLNMVLVIVNYGLGILTGIVALMASVRYLKYVVLGLSLLFILRQKMSLLQLVWQMMQKIQILFLIFLLFAFFTDAPFYSLNRTLAYLLPLLYVALSVGCLLTIYSIRSVLHALLNVLNWVYFLPIVSYFLTGGNLADTNIYYISSSDEPTAFVSNHYGWSSTIFLLTGIDLLRNHPLPNWRKYLILVFGVVALYLVFVSGNRTSWLCLLSVGLIFLFRYQGMTLYQKVILGIIPIALIFYLFQDPTSALNSRIEKTQQQAKKGEVRVKVATKMIKRFNQNPEYWITGIGLFNTPKIEAFIGKDGYHNSYFEILFGTGILVFVYFLYLFVLRPLYIYLRFFSKQYLFFLPLLIIPYFESNLTGGQFLFFPWFIMAILLSYARKFAEIQNFLAGNASP